MYLLRKKGLYESGRVLFLSVTSIVPNPDQPRRDFSENALKELADSIREHGSTYSKLADLKEVPCIVVTVDSEGSSLLALVENLQRRDLDFVEEAAALARLIQTYGLSQEEAARRIGKSQSAVANKLRLLRLSPEVLNLLRTHNCTERHARALLRLEDPELRLEAARLLIDRGLTVAQTEQLVEELMTGPSPLPRKRPGYVVRDVRLFLNTVTRGLSIMKNAGVDAACDRKETDDSILLTIRIPKQMRAG